MMEGGQDTRDWETQDGKSDRKVTESQDTDWVVEKKKEGNNSVKDVHTSERAKVTLLHGEK